MIKKLIIPRLCLIFRGLNLEEQAPMIYGTFARTVRTGRGIFMLLAWKCPVITPSVTNASLNTSAGYSVV
jgi:hypothetical protein